MIKFWIACALLCGTAWAETHRCDRACMTALTDQYLAALVKHDPAGLPLSKGVRFTENTAEIRIGDGLWVGASEAPTTFKIYAVDPSSNQVGFYGVMKENGRPLIIALRLKIVDGEITEIEHVLARNMRADRMQNLIAPRAAFLADVPPAERTSRRLANRASPCNARRRGRSVAATLTIRTPSPTAEQSSSRLRIDRRSP